MSEAARGKLGPHPRAVKLHARPRACSPQHGHMRDGPRGAFADRDRVDAGLQRAEIECVRSDATRARLGEGLRDAGSAIVAIGLVATTVPSESLPM